MQFAVVVACFLLVSSIPRLLQSFVIGIFPEDENYYSSAIIPCRDGSKTFPRHHLNDGFCDCPDGTDEPGTSACPESKFYCRNVGDVAQLLFSSRVNDRICDCCDGSDEYDDYGAVCSNTCLKNGTDDSNTSDLHQSEKTRMDRIELDLDGLLQNLKGMRIITVLEVVALMALFAIVSRRARIRRRQYLWRNK